METAVDHNSIESHEEYFRHAQTITLNPNISVIIGEHTACMVFLKNNYIILC